MSQHLVLYEYNTLEQKKGTCWGSSFLTHSWPLSVSRNGVNDKEVMLFSGEIIL
jgi:hypothetical protein